MEPHLHTQPFVSLVPRKMTLSELARAIRLDIQAELDATNLYQSHIDATDDERAKAVLAHIRDEEKEHMAEFVQLLTLLDPGQIQYLQQAPQNVADIIAQAGAGQGRTGEEPGPLTVGSLMGQAEG